MYGSNLSWKLLQGVLSGMMEQGLIEEIDKTESKDKRTNKVYLVTSKGDNVIRYFDRAKVIIDTEVFDFNPMEITE